MNANEKNLFLLGFKLVYKEETLEVYTNTQDGFEIEVAFLFPPEVRITVTAKFDSTEIKIGRTFPLYAMRGTQTEVGFEKSKSYIIEMLKLFSNILEGKSNELANEVKRIDKIDYINFD